MEEALGEIMVIPFFGQGHLNPCMELCKYIATHNFKAIFIIPSNLSSSVPSTFDHHLIEVVEIPNPSPSPSPELTDGFGSGKIDSGVYPHQHQHDLVQGTESFSSENHSGSGQTRPESESGPYPPRPRRRRRLVPGIESFLSERYTDPGQTRPGCVVIDVMMNWSREIFVNLNIPIVSFFTSGACTSAMEYAKAKENVDNMKPGETRILPGLPESMALSYADAKRQQHHRVGLNHAGRGRPGEPGSASGAPDQRRFGPPGTGLRNHGIGIPNEPDSAPPDRRRFGPPGTGLRNHGIRIPNEPDSASGPPDRRRFGPPEPGRKISWWEQAEGSIALLFNTSDDLDGAFINYIANQIGKPVWGVGPMLPEQYWESAGSIVHDHEVRSNRESNVTEDEVLQWLDSKPTQSVIYISFGSEVGPNMEEFVELANALEESNQPFIWVIQPGSGIPGPPRSMLGQKAQTLAMEEGYYPLGLDEKVGERGLIIEGWAPQLLILSHPSVGGFLSHCGWNSTAEAIGRGVPILAWPIRGDQFYNAKLVVDHLKIGHTLLTSDDPFATMKKDEIRRGIEMLMNDEEVHKQAMAIGDKFQHGFPASSAASLKAFIDLVGEEQRKKQLGG